MLEVTMMTSDNMKVKCNLLGCRDVARLTINSNGKEEVIFLLEFDHLKKIYETIGEYIKEQEGEK